MQGNRFDFYATRKDWEQVLTIVESKVSIKYIERGNYGDINEIIQYKTLLDYNKLGVSENRSTVVFGFIVIQSELTDYIRIINNSEGEKRYITGGQLYYPDSIVLKPGGIYKNTHFVYGEIDTVSKTEFSQMLFKKFKSAFRKTCRNWHGTFIGKDAETYYPKLQFSPYDGYPWDIYE